MVIFRSVITAFVIIAAAIVPGLAQDVEWSTTVEYSESGTARVVFTANIPEGWHMYDTEDYGIYGPNPTAFEFTVTQGLRLDGGIRELSAPTRHYEELFEMEIGYFEGRARFEQKVVLTSDNARLAGEIEWMLCNDGLCLPPAHYEFTVDLVRPHTAADGGSVMPVGPDTDLAEDPVIDPLCEMETREAVAQFVPAPDPLGGSLWSIIFAAMKWALLAIFTPCVFPMIPMTVSFFMKEGESKAAGRFRATMYGTFIVAIYTVPIAALIVITRIVGGDAVTSDIFNWLSTHWLPNVFFFLIFMIFAASFFGAFELNLPSWLVTRSDSRSERGELGGVFFMALTLVLVSFSCTVPIVGSALMEAVSGGSWLRPIIAILSYSIVFALPFTFFAFFPALLKKLPKSGGWLNSVKVVLGFVEVALGLKFLSVADQTYHWGILDREIYLGIWIVVFTLMGFYLLGKIKFKHDSEVKYIGVGRLFLVIATFTLVVYMIPGMFGAPLKGLSGYLPPMHTQDFVAGSTSGRSVNEVGGKEPLYSDFLELPHGLTGFFDLDEAQHYADSVGKPLFVDITGHGCVNCRRMESTVWSDPRVLEMLRQDFVIVALYVDDKKVLPEERWVTTPSGRLLKSLGKINVHVAAQLYGNNAQPLYVIQGRGGSILAGPRGYDLSIDGFVAFLRQGLERYGL